MFHRDLSEPVLVLLRDILRQGAEDLEITSLPVGGGNSPVDEDQNIEEIVQIPCIQCLGINHLVGEFELVEDEAGPPRGHGAAVLVPQADSDGVQLHGR